MTQKPNFILASAVFGMHGQLKPDINHKVGYNIFKMSMPGQQKTGILCKRVLLINK